MILEVEGNDIHSSSRLVEIIASRKPGDELHIVIQRDAKKGNISVRLQEAQQLQQIDS